MKNKMDCTDEQNKTDDTESGLSDMERSLLKKVGMYMITVDDLRSVISVIEERLDAMARFDNPDEGNIVRLLEWIYSKCAWLKD